MFQVYLSELITAESVGYPEIAKTDRGDTTILAFYHTESPDHGFADIVNRTISLWSEREGPVLRGYQCVTRSFIQRGIVGRRVLGTIPDSEGRWGAVLEGGLFLPLSDDLETNMTRLSSSHIGHWTVAEIEEILLNPVYAYGFHFTSTDAAREWLQVLLYLLAASDGMPTDDDLECMYLSVCAFIRTKVSPSVQAEGTIVAPKQFVAALKKELETVKGYLRGSEEPGISKNILMMMRSRYAYLPTVQRIIDNRLNVAASASGASEAVRIDKLQEQLQKAINSYEKGQLFEELVRRYIGSIQGLKITSVRSRQGRAEVDIYCCNVSHDPYLWKLGALVLVECKNTARKVGASKIRNLVPTMEAKGICGALIVSRSGFTRVAIQEIEHQLFGGMIIVPISLTELSELPQERATYSLLRNKLDTLMKVASDDDRQFYF